MYEALTAPKTGTVLLNPLSDVCSTVQQAGDMASCTPHPQTKARPVSCFFLLFTGKVAFPQQA
jgi:hypothetical protein